MKQKAQKTPRKTKQNKTKENPPSTAEGYSNLWVILSPFSKEGIH